LTQIRRYRVRGLPAPLERYVGMVAGDIRRVGCADIWVNPENTDMQMARYNEFSVSSIIRYEGAARDELGRVIDDCIADELMRKVAGRWPVPPATAIVTSSGALKNRGISHIVHVAAVHGEPGAGFRQVNDVGRCVISVMAEVDKIDSLPHMQSILFPLLGAGQGGGEVEATISALAGAAIDYFTFVPATRITTVYFLAYTDAERSACERLLNASGRLESQE
jgi:O-acetyl-ADP-ribose deacetylase (regulator of RNase III)